MFVDRLLFDQMSFGLTPIYKQTLISQHKFEITAIFKRQQVSHEPNMLFDGHLLFDQLLFNYFDLATNFRQNHNSLKSFIDRMSFGQFVFDQKTSIRKKCRG
jgi:hypothetical protein